MFKWISKKRNKKGFTLIELIVVIAILGILAAIAIPRLAGLQESSRVKADASTANQILNTARIIATEKDYTPTEIAATETVEGAALGFPGGANSAVSWTHDSVTYMSVELPQQDGATGWTLSYDAATDVFTLTCTGVSPALTFTN